MIKIKHIRTLVTESHFVFQFGENEPNISGPAHLTGRVGLPDNIKSGGIVKCEVALSFGNEDDPFNISLKTISSFRILEIDNDDFSEDAFSDYCFNEGVKQLRTKAEKLIHIHTGEKVILPLDMQ